MIIARCNSCHSRITLEPGIAKLDRCPFCKQSNFINYHEQAVPTDTGTQSSVIVKGGVNMEEVSKKESITDKRVADANKLREFMETELNLNKADMRKVISRLYHTIAKEMKK